MTSTTPAKVAKGAEVEPTKRYAGQQLDVTESEVFQRFLAAPDDLAGEMDPAKVSLDIIGRILQATTVDDVLEGGSAIHARDYLNRAFALLSVRFNQSDFDTEGPAFYALLEGADHNGEPIAITCGAHKVIAQAWKLQDMGALPVQVELAESDRTTKAGYKVMWLQKATKPL